MTIQSIILESVEVVRGVTIAQMRSRTRERHIVDSRRMACAVMREMTREMKMSLSSIGKEVNLYLSSGRGDNGTVSMYIKTDANLTLRYRLYRQQREQVVARVKSLYYPTVTSADAWGNLWGGISLPQINR